MDTAEMKELIQNLRVDLAEAEKRKEALDQLAQSNTEKMNVIRNAVLQRVTSGNPHLDTAIILHHTIRLNFVTFYRKLDERLAKSVGQLAVLFHWDKSSQKMILWVGSLSEETTSISQGIFYLPTRNHVRCVTDLTCPSNTNSWVLEKQPNNLPVHRRYMRELITHQDGEGSSEYAFEGVELHIGNEEIARWLKKHPLITSKGNNNTTLWHEIIELLNKEDL